MKKLSLSVILAVLMCMVSAVPAAAQFRFGIKAGVNINNVDVSNLDNNFDSKNRAGFTAGVMAEFKIPIIGLGFDASLMVSRLYAEGSQQQLVTGDGTGFQTITRSLNQTFFEIPVNLKYKFEFPAVASIIAPYVYTGPSFAFRISGNDNWLKTRTFQPSWNVGLGLELIRHLQVGAGYCFGINNIYKHFSDNTTDNIKIRNNYWTVTAAYLF